MAFYRCGSSGGTSSPVTVGLTYQTNRIDPALSGYVGKTFRMITVYATGITVNGQSITPIISVQRTGTSVVTVRCFEFVIPSNPNVVITDSSGAYNFFEIL